MTTFDVYNRLSERAVEIITGMGFPVHQEGPRISGYLTSADSKEAVGEIWNEDWMFRHAGFRCWFGSHDEEWTARWVRNPDRGLTEELWSWVYCKRCHRVLRGHDSGKRYAPPKEQRL